MNQGANQYELPNIHPPTEWVIIFNKENGVRDEIETTRPASFMANQDKD